jgi:hypothetical protein
MEDNDSSSLLLSQVVSYKDPTEESVEDILSRGPAKKKTKTNKTPKKRGNEENEGELVAMHASALWVAMYY